MKNKAWFLIKQSLKKKLDTKWFKIVNVLICLLLIGVINIDKIINVFGGDFKDTVNIYLTGDNNYLEGFNAYFLTNKKILNDERSYEIAYSSDSVDTLKEKIADTNNIVVNINLDTTEYLKADIISYNKIDTVTYNLLSASLTGMKTSMALNYNGLSSEEMAKITSPISINRVVTNEKEITASEDATNMSLVVFLVPFFMLIVLLVQMIGAEINDEKTTRGMEIIISNVPAKVHFLCKIASSTIFVIAQSLLLLLYSGLGFLIHGGLGAGLGESNIIGNLFASLQASGTLDLLAKGAPILIVIFLLSFFVYATLAGVLASMTTSAEDFQQLQTPLMIVLMLGYYIGIMAAAFKGSIFIRIISYIPFLSSMVAPITYILGETTIVDLGISAVVLLITCIFLFKYGIRVYKVGILNYSSKDLWKKVFKSLKVKDGV
mgnify:FL=1